MGALPILPERGAHGEKSRQLPDHLPARMVNEFVYCPRLFFYEWVEALFRDSADTVEGKVQHRHVDKKETELPPAEEAGPETIHSRSVTLSSERLHVIAKMDLLEGENGIISPVDYKHGRPRETENGLELWPSDRMQLGIQGLILRECGYRCHEGVAYYAKTRQRVRVDFDESLMAETERTIRQARDLAAFGAIPAPLVDSPKCPSCSMVGICLPDETNALLRASEGTEARVQLSLFGESDPEAPRKPAARQLIAARDERRPLYLNSQGFRVGKSGDVLQVRDKDALVQEVRIGELCQVALMGNVQLTTQAVQSLCAAEVPICYFSQGGWFYGITTGLNVKNIFLRQSQFRLAEEEWFALPLARRLVAGKIRNQRTMLQRNALEPNSKSLLELRQMAEQAERAHGMQQLLGVEGNAARIYFADFSGMIKTEDEGGAGSSFRFDFNGRNRRPPKDPVNAMLSLAYSLLTKDLMIACYAVGFDPLMGFYHQPRFGRPALALDLMEPFRPLIADSAVLTAINTHMVTQRDFVQAGPSVAITAPGRKKFFHAYELRMDTLVTHPLFEYRVTYRRMLEVQARLLARVLEGELGEYSVFITR